MGIKEVKEYANLKETLEAAEESIKFIENELQNLKNMQNEKVKAMSSSVNRMIGELRGDYKMLEAKTQVKPNVRGYLLTEIGKTKEFQDCIDNFKDGDDLTLKLQIKRKRGDVPLELYYHPTEGITKPVESGNFSTDETLKNVEERMKRKTRKEDIDGSFYYEE